MQKNWYIKPAGNAAIVKHLSEALNISTSLANLLSQRGVRNYEEARAFFRPSLDDLIDPFLMKDMDKAIERIERALQNNEKILIYGDYDVDGTTAVALVYSFFTKKYHGGRCSHFFGYYIPDRYAEGYGISYKGIDYAAAGNYTLMVALDCGIKSNEKILYASEKGIDFIICDHHLPGETLPEAIAVLDPERNDCPYPYKFLSGCAVGFKLLQAFAIHNNMIVDDLYDLLDLVAVSICSDIVPITGENRILVYHGLQRLSKEPSLGLRAIIKIANIEGKALRVEDVVFRIGPRINAAGRIGNGTTAVDLLTASTCEAAFEIAARINILNNERKDLDKNITEEAIQMITADPLYANSRSTVVYNENWHKGVVGIVASRLIENWYKPTIVLTRSNGFACGSARSIAGFDLYKTIEECSCLLETYGGHKHAAGLTLKAENVPAFREMFEAKALASTTPEMMVPTLEIDAELSLSDINPKFFRVLKQFEPFGPENMTPVFCSLGTTDMNSLKKVGSTQEHLKLNAYKVGDTKSNISGIAFGLAHYYDSLKESGKFDICYTIEENDFMGNINLQLMVRDFRPI